MMDHSDQEESVPKAPGRHLGAIVRGIRIAQGLTLAELGRHTGYSAAQVSRYERGLAPLTDIAVLRRFADALDIAPQILGLAPAPARGRHLQDGHQPDGSPPRTWIGAESVKPYADRGLVTRDQWNAAIHGTTREL